MSDRHWQLVEGKHLEKIAIDFSSIAESANILTYIFMQIYAQACNCLYIYIALFFEKSYPADAACKADEMNCC